MRLEILPAGGDKRGFFFRSFYRYYIIGVQRSGVRTPQNRGVLTEIIFLSPGLACAAFFGLGFCQPSLLPAHLFFCVEVPLHIRLLTVVEDPAALLDLPIQIDPEAPAVKLAVLADDHVGQHLLDPEVVQGLGGALVRKARFGPDQLLGDLPVAGMAQNCHQDDLGVVDVLPGEVLVLLELRDRGGPQTGNTAR